MNKRKIIQIAVARGVDGESDIYALSDDGVAFGFNYYKQEWVRYPDLPYLLPFDDAYVEPI
jgi:hypothetical protein